MQNQSRFIWIGLIIAIAFGLSVEFLKSARGSADSTWRPRLFGMNDLDDGDTTIVRGTTGRSEKNRDQADRARSRLLRGRVAGLDIEKASVLPVPVAIVAPVNSGAPNLGALIAINADDAKKKAAEDAKKKKKKKKKTATAEVAKPNAPVLNTPSDTAKEKSSDVGGASGSYGGSGTSHTQTIIGNNAVVENPETLEQWLAYILREPNYDHTMRLVEAQQSHNIDSEIFHEVVRQMLADSRQKMHEYAVLALGSAPSLNSFLLLEVANKAEIDATPLKIQSRNYLKAYSKLENIRYLASAIATPLETSTAYEALRLIQQAVLNYKPRANAPTTGTTVSAQAVVNKQFTTLVPVLTRVVATATDATVQQEATKALRDVNALIGTTATAPAVVASGR